MKKPLLYGTLTVLGIAGAGYAAVTAQRFYHNYQRKRSTVNTFAVQNVKTGMNIRPYNAGIDDWVKMIQYKHADWECMTWQFIQVEDGSYLLKNLYTHKTFQPAAAEAGVALWQQPLEANRYQYWELIKNSDETCLIRLKGTELYVTVLSAESNSSVILMPLQNSLEQQWRLIEQHPIV